MLNMENNDINNSNEQISPKPNLTNEEKLEILSHLIQEAEQNLEEKSISKTLIKKDDSLK